MLDKRFLFAALAAVTMIASGCCTTGSCATGCGDGCGEPCPTGDFMCAPGGADPLGYHVPPAASACGCAAPGVGCSCTACQCHSGGSACADAACATCAVPAAPCAPACAVPEAPCAPACAAPEAPCAPACAAPCSPACAAPCSPACAAPCAPACAVSTALPTTPGAQPAAADQTADQTTSLDGHAVNPQPVYPPPANASPYQVPQSAEAPVESYQTHPAGDGSVVPSPAQGTYEPPVGGDMSFYRPRVIRPVNAVPVQSGGQIRQVRGQILHTQGTQARAWKGGDLPVIRPVQAQVAAQSAVRPAVADDDLPVFYLD